MKTFLIASFVFAVAVSTGYAAPRDAGSKIRGESYGTSDEVRTARTYSNAPRNVQPAPVVAAQPAVAQPAVVNNVAPAANATTAVDNGRTGTRTFSVEPQATTAPATTYRTYAPRRAAVRGDWNNAGRKILGRYEY